MTITIPTWVFWLLGVPLAILVLLLAALGFFLLKSMPGGISR